MVIKDDKSESDILIIGAGAAGLMAARELSSAGKKVAILEARTRIGGRIFPLSEKDFGYPVQGGAEFVHGPAPITKALIKEAGLNFLEVTDGEMWKVENHELVPGAYEVISGDPNTPYRDILNDKLKNLEVDMPIASFLEEYFSEEKYTALREAIISTAEGYDAADSRRISTFALRDEWLGGSAWEQGKIKEGYGALLDFLAADCEKNHVKILLGRKVESVDMDNAVVKVSCANGETYEAKKVLVTLPLPLIKSIRFIPALPGKIIAASDIGYGGVIKIMLRFNSVWWVHTAASDLSKLTFLFSKERVPLWWTQYPKSLPVLTGWIAGPSADKWKNMTTAEILDIALESLANIFKISKEDLYRNCSTSAITNWPSDPLSQGAYSYATVGAEIARAILVEPVNNMIFFAGEAIYSGKDTATVEGALGSGKEVAKKMLDFGGSPRLG